ncbi:hypothetical protein K469DRAFT_712526 [Zopfia rhizophila CBS 207.26]|uniref:Uncharacterized protein n=1 Tax=Zopfia rhizophila CBS 207.26 TaxID=1314779 RepID=A0A6A6ERV7_9PEZI|nr:hypothetical protein K469DRAFT_712526 [Zopfia rhizophila CBS 207.26]
MVGNGQYLRFTRHLVLSVGENYYKDNASTWYEVPNQFNYRWDEELDNKDGWELKMRRGICSRGRIVNWTLSYTLHNNYLQHMPRIELKADIQTWVREKWESIFKRHRNEERFVHDVDLGAIELIGRD